MFLKITGTITSYDNEVSFLNLDCVSSIAYEKYTQTDGKTIRALNYIYEDGSKYREKFYNEEDFNKQKVQLENLLLTK